MRTNRAFLFIIATLRVSFPAWSSAQGAVVDKTTFKGTDIATEFTVNRDVSCPDGSLGRVAASGFVLGSSLVVKVKGDGKTSLNAVFVELDSYSDTCSGKTLGFATESFPDGLNPPNKNLKKATMAGNAVLADPEAGVDVLVALDINVAGVGPLSSQSDSTRTRTVMSAHGPITITVTKSTGNGRDGVASGTMTFDGLTVNPSFSLTSLGFDKNVDVTIEK